MDLWALNDFKNKEHYFYNIGLKALETCIKDYDSKTISDEEKSCLKSTSLNLHHIIHESRLDRWSLNEERRPFEEYWWIRAKP